MGLRGQILGLSKNECKSKGISKAANFTKTKPEPTNAHKDSAQTANIQKWGIDRFSLRHKTHAKQTFSSNGKIYKTRPEPTNATKHKYQNRQNPKMGHRKCWPFVHSFALNKNGGKMKLINFARGTWCSGITSASHAEGPGFNPQCVHCNCF